MTTLWPKVTRGCFPGPLNPLREQKSDRCGFDKANLTLRAPRVCYERTTWSPTVQTFVLSAIWHGVYPGYYLTFLTGVLMTLAARAVSARGSFPAHGSPGAGPAAGGWPAEGSRGSAWCG